MLRAKLILGTILLIVCAQLQCVAACAAPPASMPPCHHQQQQDSNCADHPLVSQAAPVAAPFVSLAAEPAGVIAGPLATFHSLVPSVEISALSPLSLASTVLRI